MDLEKDIAELELAIKRLGSWSNPSYEQTQDFLNAKRWLNELLEIKKKQLGTQ